MGVNPTPTNYKSFTFDGKSSREFGVYTTGEGVFNSPERDVEMISIPARNGEYALDKGHFNNIEVTYNCGIVADTDADFAKAISDFRNWLCSRQGYCRLVDEYNPNEYRMGLFREVVEVDHEGLRTGEFEITFDCKPQRWLTSGETAVTVADGGTIDNPTLFEASPLLSLYGYGNLDIDGQSITLNNSVLGTIRLNNRRGQYAVESFPYTFNLLQSRIDDLEAGDRIHSSSVILDYYLTARTGYTINGFSLTSTSGVEVTLTSGTSIHHVKVELPGLEYQKGTASSVSGTAVFSVNYTYNGTTTTTTITRNYTLSYDGNIGFSFDVSSTLWPTPFIKPGTGYGTKFKYVFYYGDSTKITYGNPSYIDCEIGEAYMYAGGGITPLNNLVVLPSDLPTLKPGTNTINFDNTFTQVDIVPRWWRV